MAMATPAVLQVTPISEVLRAALESKFELYLLWEEKDKEAFFAEKGSKIRGVVTAPSTKLEEALLSKLPNLEIVSTFSVGIDGTNFPALQARGILLTNTPDVLTYAVAECAIALLLATTRKIVAADRFVRDGKWQAGWFPLTVQLNTKHVGVIGLGRIGAAIAKLVGAFGATISYWGRSAKPEFPEYTFYDNIVNLAKDCDILIVACSLTKGTNEIVNREVLDALGPKGIVVNIARGAVIDEVELVKALVEGRIAGAGLDVFADEPHVPKELLTLDNVVLHPHHGSGTLETREQMNNIVVANLEAHFSGKPLLTLVTDFPAC